MSSVLWLIPGLPLLASVVIAALGPRYLKQQSHWVCVLGTFGACLLSWFVFANVGHADFAKECGCVWFEAGQAKVGFSFRADGLTAVMLITITTIGTLIAVFAAGYMHGDPGYPRFFAVVSLFIFSMTGLVLANNFVLLYAFWEGVGLCSYLLIGFWFHKPSAAAAARKAFLVTRLGDVGLLVGILLIWYHSGFKIEFHEAFASIADSHWRGATVLNWICVLLFCGAVGKSAQFPLHVWLPDAMEGPTPVSALIHAATMVTAGVYLVARCNPLFSLAPDIHMTVAIVGGITAILAAFIALTQNDLKRVLAYSTVSQLGFMFLALGCGAVVPAIFHLFTHAFFKALLFLGSGSVMHAMGNVLDMNRIGGLRKLLPRTHLTFLAGSAALAGVPLLSGFWSKDEILASLLQKGQEQEATLYTFLFGVALLTAGLTAFYTFRAYFRTFWGEEKIPHEAGHHAHESPAIMTIPLMLLAIGAVGAGIVFEPFTHRLSHKIIDQSPVLKLEAAAHGHYYLVMGLSTVVGLLGIALAYGFYVKQPEVPRSLAKNLPTPYQFSLNKCYLDELYDRFLVQPITGTAEFCGKAVDVCIDLVVDLVGHVPRLLGQLFQPVQNGLVQFYALAMVLGIAVFLLALAWK